MRSPENLNCLCLEGMQVRFGLTSLVSAEKVILILKPFVPKFKSGFSGNLYEVKKYKPLSKPQKTLRPKCISRISSRIRRKSFQPRATGGAFPDNYRGSEFCLPAVPRALKLYSGGAALRESWLEKDDITFFSDPN